METKNVLTLLIAVLGAALGVFNTWQNWRDRRVRLKVEPMGAFAVEIGAGREPRKMVSVEIINLSAFPVTIQSAGFRLPGKHVLVPPLRGRLAGEQDWPRRLEPRGRTSAYFSPEELHPNKNPGVGRCFAKTACGVTCYGKKPKGLIPQRKAQAA